MTFTANMSHKHSTTLDPIPRRLPPAQYSSDSRSRSQSRTRFQRSSAHDSDPLLSNLSPTSTLEALSYTDFRPDETRKASSELRESIASASSSERALGIRAASAGKKLKEWHAEVAGWAWPGPTEGKNGFEVPSAQEHGTGREDAGLGVNGDHGQDLHAGPDREQEFWGSLRRDVVEEYEERIEAIADGMEALDVEELKSHVLEAHMPSLSSSASTAHQREAGLETLNRTHLDDFTAVVTATILQALPYVARLTILLHTWSVRLVILRQVPGFLRALEDARTAVTSGWSTISVSGASTPGHGTGVTREAFNVMQPILEDRLTAAGQRLDRMLDALEGREDTVPKQWIDHMEMLEDDYSNWAVEAEKKVLENELREYRNNHLEPTRQPAMQQDVAQNLPGHCKLSLINEDEVSEGPYNDDQDVLSNELQPSPQVPEVPKTVGVTGSLLGSSPINDRSSGKKSPIPPTDHEDIPHGKGVDIAQDRMVVPSPAAKSLPPRQYPKPVENLSEPVSTARSLPSSGQRSDFETPSSAEEQNPLVREGILADDQWEQINATGMTQHWSSKSDDNNHAMWTSHEVHLSESSLPRDHQHSIIPQPMQQTQLDTSSSEPLPQTVSDRPFENLVRDTLQTDGASEYHNPQKYPDERTNQRMSNTSNVDANGKDSTHETNSIPSTGSMMVVEPTTTNSLKGASDESSTSISLEDTLRLSPKRTAGDSDQSVDNATFLPMPGSWDEEGVNIDAAQDPANTPSPSNDLATPHSLTEPEKDAIPPPHDRPSEDSHEHVESTFTENRPDRPTALTLPLHITHADQTTSSDNSRPGSATSDFYSNASSPEIRDARAAQSFGKPVEVTSPIRLSDRKGQDQLSPDTWSPSQQTVRASHNLLGQGDIRASTTPVLQRNRGSNFALEPTIHEDPVSRHHEDLSHEGGGGDIEMRRASVASIEVLSRNEVGNHFSLRMRTRFRHES